jgi:hypothetical protein
MAMAYTGTGMVWYSMVTGPGHRPGKEFCSQKKQGRKKKAFNNLN